jgi:hypothetical protein
MDHLLIDDTTEREMQRREFLRAGSVIVAASAVPVLLVASMPLTADARRRRRGQIHSLANYRDCIGTWFYVRDESWKRVKLVEVREHIISDEVEQFSCQFRGTSRSAIRSGTHDVRSRFLGRFQLYLTAIEDDGYESFSRADFALLR